MSRVFYLIVFLLLILLGLVFAVLNAESVTFNYYFGQFQIPLSGLVVVAVFVGAILGVIAMSGVVMKARREAAKSRKHAELAEKEINNLRSIPIKNQH